MVIGPGADFAPLAHTLHAGSHVYRMFGNRSGRGANVCNPGRGGRSRFAFFGNPVVPVLYAAESEQAAVCETLLHDIPQAGGVVGPDEYADKVMNRMTVKRELNLASFMGPGLRALRVEARDLKDTPASRYGETVKWAEAAHAAGFDGAVWMSRRCNSDRAYVFFGDRISEPDLEIDAGFSRAFAFEGDVDWLTDFCTPLHVEVRAR